MAFAIGSKARLPLLPFRANISALQDSLYVAGCCFALPSQEGYIASAHPVTQMHWLPATWPPDRYQDWTFTSEQMMTFQDTRAGVRQLISLLLKLDSGCGNDPASK